MILQWRHNEHDSISNHQPHDCLLNCLFRCRSKKTSKLRATGFCVGNSPVTSKFHLFPFDGIIMESFAHLWTDICFVSKTMWWYYLYIFAKCHCTLLFHRHSLDSFCWCCYRIGRWGCYHSWLRCIYQWFSARLQYLQCVSNGDTAVLH